MRRAFIAFGIAVFLIYCWASVAYQNRVDVPEYKLVIVDLLGGASRAQWDADQQAQFQRLMHLEGRNYQLPADAKLPAGAPPAKGGAAAAKPGEAKYMPVDRPLTSDDFTRLIARSPGLSPVRLQLRDTSEFYNLLAKNYLLRDSIPNPADPDGPPLYDGGQQLHKDMLDDLRLRGFKTITVTGHGAPVGFQIGTALMLAIIFLTLVAALKPVLWEPFMAMLERRKRELETGAEAERQNQQEAIRFEEERRGRNLQLDREIQSAKMRNQSDIAREAGEIVKAARNEEKEVKLAGLRQLSEESKQAAEALERDIPALAQAVADALTPGRKSKGN